MGTLLSSFFIDVNLLKGDYIFFQLIFLLAAYGFILLKASKLISNGAQLLLLTPYAGVIGSVVLPIFGALPDSMIVLFSGLGKNAKKEVEVGVGALAGSTILLLTVPWFLSNLSGRVDLDHNGRGLYRKKPNKLSKGICACRTTGSNPRQPIRAGGVLMSLTLLPYLIVQIGGFINPKKGQGPPHAQVKWLVFSGLIMTVILFVLYLVYSFAHQDDECKTDKVEEVKLNAVKNKLMSFGGAFKSEIQRIINQDKSYGSCQSKVERALRHLFRKYDRDHSNSISTIEMHQLLKDMGETELLEDSEFSHFMRQIDKDRDGVVSFKEFHAYFARNFQLIKERDLSPLRPKGRRMEEGRPFGRDYEEDFQLLGAKPGSEIIEPDSEEETQEIPHDLASLPPQKQQRAIKLRSFIMLMCGTLMILVFSDPTVLVIDKLGEYSNIPSFYVSFILAPLATNSAEILSAYEFAKKQTQKHITISFTQLQGSACMNNTFCLGIFLAMIFSQNDLTWEYSSETLGIVIVEVLVILISLLRTQTLLTSFLVLMCFPLSLALISFFENFIGWN